MTYLESCKAACKWCAEGLPARRDDWRGGQEHFKAYDTEVSSDLPGVWMTCTAPTQEQFIEQQAARVGELENRVRQLEAERNLIASQANRLNDELNTLRKQLDDERFVSQNLQRTIDVIAKGEHTNAEHRKLLRSVLDRERDSLRQRVSALEAEREQQAAQIAELKAEVDAAESQVVTKEARIGELEALLNTPEVESFDAGVPLEAAHQVQRWTAAHDAGKNPEDWFWLVGYLAGKALSAMKAGDAEKAKHHCISTAAALRNWHAHIRSGETAMRPGISEEKQSIAESSEQEALIRELLEACKMAKKYLEPDLVEPGRTVFWALVAAIAKAKAEQR